MRAEEAMDLHMVKLAARIETANGKRSFWK